MSVTTRWNIYRLDTGAFIGHCSGGDADFAALNTPTGCGVVEGAIDHDTNRVVPGSSPPQVESFTPAGPSADELQQRHDYLVKCAIADAESGIARPLRETLLAITSGTTAPTAAVQRLATCDAEIAALRAKLGTMN